MSSFICNSKHFNSIENKLSNMFAFDDWFYLPNKLKPIYPELSDRYNTKIKEVVKNIMDELRELNVVCVTLQYKHHYNDVNTEIIDQKTDLFYNTSDYKELTPLGLYNALRCLSYQIEIRHLEDLSGLTEKQQNAMYFLEEIIKELAEYICSKLPDDKTNTWEIY